MLDIQEVLGHDGERVRCGAGMKTRGDQEQSSMDGEQRRSGLSETTATSYVLLFVSGCLDAALETGAREGREGRGPEERDKTDKTGQKKVECRGENSDEMI